MDARSAPVGQKPRMASVSLHAHRQSVPEDFPERMIFINLYMKLNLVPMAGIDNFVRSKVGRTKCARRAEAKDGFCQPARP